MRRGAKPGKAKAKQAVVRKSLKSHGSTVRDLEKRLAEAQEQQTATAEILRIISRSQTDVQPVFDAIADSLLRLFHAWDAWVARYDGELLHIAAVRAGRPEATPRGFIEPFPPTPELTVGRCVLAASVIHIADTNADPGVSARSREIARSYGWRSALAAPMLRNDQVIGVVMVTRTEARAFAKGEIELIQTFAAQAVIAIENVRLFNETKEALEQQTATADILRVISSSPTDVQPVFDTIAENATLLCEAVAGSVVRFDGELIHLVATYNLGDRLDALARRYPTPPRRDTAMARAIADGAVVHIPNTAEDPEYNPDYTADVGPRCVLAVPIVRHGGTIGAIGVSRIVGRPYSENQIGLLKTFAAQGVIAIENVRLFTELEARNRDLSESLEQQTATGEILRAISGSPTDAQPVFEAIADSVLRLCDGLFSAVYRVEGNLAWLVAHRNVPGRLAGQSFRIGPGEPESLTARTVLDLAVVHVRDSEVDAGVPAGSRELARLVGYRSIAEVPMLRQRRVVGVISVARAGPGFTPRPFSDREIALLQTFADQAVIAIENVRLFQELRARTAELTRSVEQLTALGDVGRALNSTLDLDTVLQAIVTRASQLAGGDACSVFEYDEATEAFHLRATHNLDQEVVAVARRTPIHRGEGIQGRMAVTRQPVQIPDIAASDAYRGPLRDILLRTGTRALLAIPMQREDELIGGLTVNKKTPGAFAPEVIELLQTFATQSALAIQNARLFRELEAKSRQLEAASRHKSEFLANMSHELRTPLNAIIGFSEVLGERMFGDVNEKQAEYLQDILDSGRHLLSLINDILDLSKVEAGRLELELGGFHVPTALDNALILLRERATRHGITLTQTVDERVGDIVADERKVKQILLNLLSNAVKFTPEGGRVGVTATAVQGVITIAVSDTGIGIAPEDQAAVFEEFRQVGRDDPRKQEGTGLGLTLAKKFVELHGGRIWVESQVGQGSTFTFSLPVGHGE